MHERRSRECMNYKFTTSHKRYFPISHEWLSRRGEIKIHHARRSRKWWIFILPQLLSHEWGIGKYLLWRVVNLPSLQLSMNGLTFLYSKWTLEIIHCISETNLNCNRKLFLRYFCNKIMPCTLTSSLITI